MKRRLVRPNSAWSNDSEKEGRRRSGRLPSFFRLYCQAQCVYNPYHHPSGSKSKKSIGVSGGYRQEECLPDMDNLNRFIRNLKAERDVVVAEIARLERIERLAAGQQRRPDKRSCASNPGNNRTRTQRPSFR
jgi:hypothetical protein